MLYALLSLGSSLGAIVFSSPFSVKDYFVKTNKTQKTSALRINVTVVTVG